MLARTFNTIVASIYGGDRSAPNSFWRDGEYDETQPVSRLYSSLIPIGVRLFTIFLMSCTLYTIFSVFIDSQSSLHAAPNLDVLSPDAPLVDVGISQTVAPKNGDANVDPGELLTFVLSLSGINTASNVVVTSTIPSGITIFGVSENSLTIQQLSGGPNYRWSVTDFGSVIDGSILLFGVVDNNLPGGTVLTSRAGIRADNDPNAANNYAEATISVVNVAPIALDKSITINEDSTLSSYSVLAGATDGNGDTISLVAVGVPDHGGTATFAGGAVTYKPAPDFYGVEQFTYTINDGNGGTDTANVTVTVNNVNDPPRANDDTFTVDEDSVDSPLAVVSNDTYLPDPVEVLSIESLGTTDHGGMIVRNLSQILYTPAPNFHGIETFTYTIRDGNGGTATAKVTVTVNNVNDPPTANNDTTSVAEDSVDVMLDPLANDSSLPDTGESLTIVAVGLPTQNGSVTNRGDHLLYSPTANFYGTETFTYTISDGNGGMDTATMQINVTSVNDPPVANDDTATMQEDSGTIRISPLTNDQITPDVGETLALAKFGASANGATILRYVNQIDYTPAINFYGNDVFTYTVSDGNGGLATAKITVTVANVNDPPTAVDDTVTLENTNDTVMIAVLANDSSLPDPLEILAIVAIGPTEKGSTVVISGTTMLRYTPVAQFTGRDRFTYTISDGHGAEASASVTVYIGDSDGDGISDYEECNGDIPNCPDTDGDGIPDHLDPDDDGPGPGDSDGDGVPDDVECPGGVPCMDTDHDGTPDYLDTDDDDDGIPTIDEDDNTDGDGNPSTDPRDVDRDGIPDYLDADTDGPGPGDSDGDGIPDNVECPTWPPCVDTDDDGVPDYMDDDSDGDNVPDSEEGERDTDGDGKPNYRDTDDDNDNIPTATECPNGPPCPDSDDDGIPDYLESDIDDNDNDDIPNVRDADSDGDGLTDRYEGQLDTDHDNLPDYLDRDSDGDGIYDVVESGHADRDTNRDGIMDNLIDSDKDGLPDLIDPDQNGQPVTPTDSDIDGIPDHLENNLQNTDDDDKPNHLDPDDDGDGLLTREECPNGLPHATPCRDSDGDTIPDYLESNILDHDGDGIFDYLDGDSDGDGIPDDVEGDGDTDHDGLPNYLDRDADGDNIFDIDEVGIGDLDADNDGIIDNQADTDGDGVADLVDPDQGGTVITPDDTDHDGVPNFLEPNNVDTDMDGIPNHQDDDDDGDGIPTRQECASGQPCPDADNDSIPNYLEHNFLDTDNDGIPNFADRDADGDGIPDRSELDIDTDGDGVPNNLDLDADGDDINDLEEAGLSDLDGNGDGRLDDLQDSDGDGIADVVDPARGGVTVIPTDSDGDGLADYLEDNNADYDNDGKPHHLDSDDDGDGIPTSTECPRGIPCPDEDRDGIPTYLDRDETATNSGDSDKDGLTDAAECPNGIPCPDTDGDGIPNYLDPNSIPDRKLDSLTIYLPLVRRNFQPINPASK